MSEPTDEYDRTPADEPKWADEYPMSSRRWSRIRGPYHVEPKATEPRRDDDTISAEDADNDVRF